MLAATIDAAMTLPVLGGLLVTVLAAVAFAEPDRRRHDRERGQR